LKQKIDRKDDFLLVETLPATVYHHNHLPGAINLPPDSVTKLAPQLLPEEGAEIIVYCANPT
jgi:rhodanese-related sulfurtransferase